MAEKNNYKKGFGDGYEKGKKEMEKDVNKKVTDLNKKLGDNLKAHQDHKGGQRNG